MFEIISQSSTRIKTGLVLVAIFLVVGIVDSFFITWFLLGGLMMVALYEALQLFDCDDEKMYIYAAVIWFVASFYPKPEDLVFVVGIIFASVLA